MCHEIFQGLRKTTSTFEMHYHNATPAHCQLLESSDAFPASNPFNATCCNIQRTVFFLSLHFTFQVRQIKTFLPIHSIVSGQNTAEVFKTRLQCSMFCILYVLQCIGVTTLPVAPPLVSTMLVICSHQLYITGS